MIANPVSIATAQCAGLVRVQRDVVSDQERHEKTMIEIYTFAQDLTVQAEMSRRRGVAVVQIPDGDRVRADTERVGCFSYRNIHADLRIPVPGCLA